MSCVMSQPGNREQFFPSPHFHRVAADCIRRNQHNISWIWGDRSFALDRPRQNNGKFLS
jgi:hypothetical protein